VGDNSVRVGFERGLVTPDAELTLRAKRPDSWVLCGCCGRAFVNGHRRRSERTGAWLCPYLDCMGSVLFQTEAWWVLSVQFPQLPVLPKYGVKYWPLTEEVAA
jgi:hypothetical protein